MPRVYELCAGCVHKACCRTAFLPERRRMMPVCADYLAPLKSGEEDADSNASSPTNRSVISSSHDRDAQFP